ncbi:2-hydroxychromene-2-carboxylate isomerase [Caballeronia sp. 15715]|uniref:2-hydroxychromene-2-carboxylate isomerase n=1 Tax=Caballeronia sp. 15715 TaxID=3391030 RepID=UPI0039E5D97F
MSKQVEFFFDVGSPASYLAWTQLPSLCLSTGSSLIYRPMLLGGVFQAVGNASPAAIPAKGVYSTTDLGRYAKRYGVTLVQNPHFPIITLTLMRVATGVQIRMPERLPDFLEAIFKAIWVNSLNLNDPTLVARTLSDAGFDSTAIVNLASDADIKAALRATTEEAVARGAFGAPTMFIEGQMYFGQDRLDFVRDALS